MRKVDYIAKVNIGFAIVNIILSIIFVKYTSIGVPGVILATVIVELIRRPLISMYAAHSCGMSMAEYFQESYKKPLLVLLALMIVVLPVRSVFSVNSLWNLFLHGAMVLFLWIFVGWKVGLNCEDRLRVRRVLKIK